MVWETEEAPKKITVDFKNGQSMEVDAPLSRAGILKIAKEKKYSRFNVFKDGAPLPDNTTEITEGSILIEEYNEVKGKSIYIWMS
jgi:hypothetical protein